MTTQAIARRRDEEPQSALAYWGTGLLSIAMMLLLFIFAGYRF